MRTCILGVGNELWGDDGIGPAVIAELMIKKWSVPVDLFSIEDDLFRIYDYLGEYLNIVIIDALPPDREPGKIHIFNWDTLISNPDNILSLHDIDLISLLIQVKRLSYASITLLGIETYSIEWRIGLSPEINQKLHFVADQVYQLLTIKKIKNVHLKRS